MAKRQTDHEIDGIFLGGVVPLSAVGYVLAALYKYDADQLKLVPSIATPIKKQQRLPHGIAGLLPPPQKKHGGKKFVILRAVYGAPAGLRLQDIQDRLEAEGFSRSPGEVYALYKDKQLKKNDSGLYVTGPKAPARESLDEPNAPAVVGEASPKTKKQIALDTIAAGGGQPVSTMAIKAALKKARLTYDSRPFKELLEEKQIIKVGYGKYVLPQKSR